MKWLLLNLWGPPNLGYRNCPRIFINASSWFEERSVTVISHILVSDVWCLLEMHHLGSSEGSTLVPSWNVSSWFDGRLHARRSQNKFCRNQLWQSMYGTFIRFILIGQKWWHRHISILIADVWYLFEMLHFDQKKEVIHIHLEKILISDARYLYTIHLDSEKMVTPTHLKINSDSRCVVLFWNASSWL